jgi:hypothetical protein
MLDELYGRSIPPEGDKHRPDGYDPHEMLPPRSLSILSAETAEHLKGFMKSVEAAWAIGNLFMARTTVLWLVDKDGDIRFAVEEYVHNSEMAEFSEAWYQDIPYHRITDDYDFLLPTNTKLGHPSLVSCQEARIGGEIRFYSLDGADHKTWNLNAHSGRYGAWVTHAQRRKSHLWNAKYRFRDHGVALKLDAKGPRGWR